MQPVTLEKEQWHPYFECLTKAVARSRAEIELAALPIGVQTDAPWVALAGVVYHSESDCVDIALEHADKTAEDYVIRAPQEVYLYEGPSGLAGMEIIDGDGVRHKMQLREPLKLPVAA